MARGYAQARTEAVKGLSFSPSAILTYPLKSRTEAAITELESLGQQNPDIDPKQYGRHMDFYTEDGSKATFAISRNAQDDSFYLRAIESVSGKGAGTAFMKAMVAIADKYKVPISLNVEPFTKDRNAEATEEARARANEAIKKNSEEAKARGELPKPIKVDFSGGVKTVSAPSFDKIVSFYERFGFKPTKSTKHRFKDKMIEYVMVRQPN
jgi:hypothetical protein